MNHSIVLGSRRFLRPGKLLWLRALAWAIGFFLAMGVVVSLVQGVVFVLGALSNGTPLDQAMAQATPVVDFAASALAAVVSVALYVGLVRLCEDRLPVELAPRAALAEIPIGLGLGAAMMATTVFLLWAGGWVSVGSAPLRTVSKAIGLSLQSGVVEEVLFRLIVLRLLWRAFGPWPALALSAFLFGALHLANPNASWFAAICIAIEAGIMLAGFYILTGRLWVSIGVHAGWNFTQGWIFGAAVSGTNGFEGGPLTAQPTAGAPEILSGGGFGPEASLAGLLVGTAVGAATLWLAWKRNRFAAIDESEPAAFAETAEA